jgi:N-acetylneuraminic acid mutarotase
VGVAELDGRIYVIGGFDEEGAILDTVEYYDTLAGTWHTAAPLPQRLHHVPTVSVYGRIYTLGGLGPSGFTPAAAVYTYDPETDVWEARAPLPTARGAAGAAVIEGRIYVAGGLAATATDEFTVYDPDFDAWEMLPPMPTARDHLGAAVVGGVFYAIGGRAGGIAEVFDVVEAYNPTLGRWETQLAPLPTGRAAFATAALGGRIFVIGGEGNPDRLDGVFPQVEAFDPGGDFWVSLPDMLTPRHGMGAATFGGRIYVPGGATVAGFAASAVNEALFP